MTSTSEAPRGNQFRTYDRESSVVFLKTNERFGGLSNMAPGFPLRVNGVRIRTSEALYQACRFPHLPDVQRKIIDEHSPMTAKMRSKPFRKDSRPDWDAVRVKIMRWCLRVKLAQNWREFGRLLLATGDRPIVEQSRKDDFWGAKVAEDGSLVGMNVLGRLLMELREQLKGDEAEGLHSVEPLAIPEFLLFQRPIELIFAESSSSLPVEAEARPARPVAAPPPRDLPQPSLFDQPMIAKGQMDIQTDPAVVAKLKQSPAAYPAYRPARVHWLGEIPSHWSEKRGKYFFREIDERSQTGEEELLSVSHTTGVTPRSQKNVTMFKAESYVGHKVARPNDVVINTMWAWMSALGVSKNVGIVSPAYGVYRPVNSEDFLPEYVDYLLRTPMLRWEYICRSTGIRASRLRLYPDKFLDIAFPCPPREEQERMVAFLRAKEVQVRRLIRNKRRLIGLLNEQKQAIINRAVTRGLNPDAPMKPTGINWMPEVPAHWQTIHLGSKIKLINGYPFDSKLFFNDGTGHSLIRIRDIFREDTVVTYAGEFVEEATVQTGDILVGMDGDFNVARWKGTTALLNQRVCCLRPKEHLDEVYLASLLAFPLKWINDQTFSTTVKHLSSSDIKRLRFPVPPLEEQREISAWLSAETATLERMIDRVQREIQLVREYRERLIADVVTGKQDVRHVEILAAAEDPGVDDHEELEDEAETVDAELMAEVED